MWVRPFGDSDEPDTGRLCPQMVPRLEAEATAVAVLPQGLLGTEVAKGFLRQCCPFPSFHIMALLIKCPSLTLECQFCDKGVLGHLAQSVSRTVPGTQQGLVNICFVCVCFVFCLFFFFCLFRATPTAYGSSQARCQVRAVAASLHHSCSNTGSEPRL